MMIDNPDYRFEHDILLLLLLLLFVAAACRGRHIIVLKSRYTISYAAPVPGLTGQSSEK